jgi:Ran GTPase-activating protein (RanGAP) involved in mRNA processing and transport
VLSSLNLSHNQLGDGGTLLLTTGLSENHSLRYLLLQDTGLSAEAGSAIATLLAVNTTLLQLDLSENQLGCDGVATLCSGLLQNRTLCTLSLRMVQLTDRGTESLATVLAEQARTASSGLRSLDLGGNTIGETNALHLSVVLGDSLLQSLNLRGNQLHDEYCVALAQASNSPHSRLQHLYVGCNPCSGTE